MKAAQLPKPVRIKLAMMAVSRFMEKAASQPARRRRKNAGFADYLNNRMRAEAPSLSQIAGQQPNPMSNIMSGISQGPRELSEAAQSARAFPPQLSLGDTANADIGDPMIRAMENAGGGGDEGGGLMDMIQRGGGQALDWIKGNPGPAAGIGAGVGIPAALLLAHMLRNRGEEEEDPAAALA